MKMSSSSAMIHMNLSRVCVFAAILLGSLVVGTDICKDSAVIYASCPNHCHTGPTAIGDAFNECANLEQFGCTLQSCEGGLRCVTGDTLPEHIRLCPGQRLVFRTIHASDEVKFFIDFTALPLETDLYLLSDATGSMRRAIETAKSKFQNLVKEFEGRTNIAVGVGIFRDEVELDNGFKNLQPISTSISAAQEAINTIHATGGLDAPEANLVALYKIATDSTIQWRSRSRKILVYFGDNPGHEATCFNGITLTRERVIAALKAKGITVIAVSFNTPGLDGATRSYRCGTTTSTAGGQASAITLATNGRLVMSADQTQLIEAIRGGIRDLPKTYEADISDCVEKIDTSFNPPLPLTLAPGASHIVTQTMKLKPRVCSLSGSRFSCQIKYKESGADLPPTDVEVLEVTGCPGRR